MKKGNDTPTRSVVIQDDQSKGLEAINLYNDTYRQCQKWQGLQLTAILAYNDDGLWTHTKYGYSVPRRNGKNEIVAMRELYGLMQGERILHTAHRTTTSHSAAVRLVQLLDELGYTEIQRMNKEKRESGGYTKAFTFGKQFGLEKIVLMEEGGEIDFRTRSGKGGLGEGFDLLIVDEAQEYTDEQESALKYVVSDSKNPQTIFCGTPPTQVSSGTVFMNFRNEVLAGKKKNAGWAEWSVDEISDPHDVSLWYLTNPSLGTILTERKIEDEISGDDVDFNIQRLGLWLQHNLKSAISKVEWQAMQVSRHPQFENHDKYIGVKFGKDGTNVSMAIAVKAKNSKIFVEVIDCKPMRDGVKWIVDWLSQAQNVKKVCIDGANGQAMLAAAMKDEKLKKPILPTVKEVINANAVFEQAVFNKTLVHMGQEELTNVVSNCEKRNIGSNGGFGYNAQLPDTEIALMDSVILAHWLAVSDKSKGKQTIKY